MAHLPLPQQRWLRAIYKVMNNNLCNHIRRMLADRLDEQQRAKEQINSTYSSSPDSGCEGRKKIMRRPAPLPALGNHSMSNNSKSNSRLNSPVSEVRSRLNSPVSGLRTPPALGRLHLGGSDSSSMSTDGHAHYPSHSSGGTSPAHFLPSLVLSPRSPAAAAMSKADIKSPIFTSTRAGSAASKAALNSRVERQHDSFAVHPSAARGQHSPANNSSSSSFHHH